MDASSVRVGPGTHYRVGSGDMYLSPSMALPTNPTQLELQVWPELDARGERAVPNRADRRRKKARRC